MLRTCMGCRRGVLRYMGYRRGAENVHRVQEGGAENVYGVQEGGAENVYGVQEC